MLEIVNKCRISLYCNTLQAFDKENYIYKSNKQNKTSPFYRICLETVQTNCHGL